MPLLPTLRSHIQSLRDASQNLLESNSSNDLALPRIHRKQFILTEPLCERKPIIARRCAAFTISSESSMRHRPSFSASKRLGLGLQSSTHQESAQAEQHKPWLAPHDVPEQARRFVAVDLTERLARGSVEKVDKLRIIFLL